MPARRNNKRRPSSPALKHLYERFVEGDAEQEAARRALAELGLVRDLADGDEPDDNAPEA